MTSKNLSKRVMKENRIPIGKKRENLDKIKALHKNDELEVVVSQTLSKNKKSTNKNVNKINHESKPLKIININEAPTDTSLMTQIEKPRTKLSTIKETDEKLIKSINANVKQELINSIKIVANDDPTQIEKKNDLNEDGSTKLVKILQEDIDMDIFNNTIDKMKPTPPAPEVVLSPYVCATRGKKWKPTPRKPPKLSELFEKYEDNNVADTYRKKLDGKTVELQSKVTYWTELSSVSNIPQSIKDEIDAMCGQTKLLTTDKFMQMRSLIEEFDNKSGAMPITMSDLDGFWDMLLLQVEKLEGQFHQLTILKENNWTSLEPIAKKVINKVLKVNKRPVVKSQFANFIKNQKLKEKKETQISENSNEKSDEKGESISNSKFNEMKLSNNTLLISSTPSSLNKKNLSFTPVLLKTMELSYVARRSGMTPIVLGKPHISPLKPALKNREHDKSTKRKNIHFETPKTTSDQLVTPVNSCNEDMNDKKKSTKGRTATPHAVKTLKIDDNCSAIKKVDAGLKNTDSIGLKKTNVKTTKAAAKNCLLLEMSTDTLQNNNDCTIRRSSRLANKPTKNYKY